MSVKLLSRSLALSQYMLGCLSPLSCPCTRRRLALILLGTLVAAGGAWGDILVCYDFASGLEPSQQDARFVHVSPLKAAWALEEVSGGAVVANDWNAEEPANYYCFTIVLTPEYVLDLESVTFDYMSEQSTYWDGPDTGEVRLAVDTQPFQSISGGWQAIDPDGVWHRDVVADNGGTVVSNLSGRIIVAVAARGASDSIAKLSLDNIRVAGTLRFLSAGVPAPSITSFSPAQGWLVGHLDSNRYYSLQTSTEVGGGSHTAFAAANFRSAQPALTIPVQPAAADRAFTRILSTRRPVAAADAEGFWQVSSTGALFRAGVMQITQYPYYVQFEDLMIGTLEGQAFSFGHCDGNSTGTTDGVTLNAVYYSKLESGTVQSGTFTGVRYTGPKFEIWEGNAVLTHAQRYDPASNGYTRIVQASSTVTVGLSKTNVLLVATTPTRIDAFQGQNSAYLVAVNSSGGSISDLNAIYGEPDGGYCEVGTGYSGAAYRGYLTFAPPGWSSMTVYVAP